MALLPSIEDLLAISAHLQHIPPIVSKQKSFVWTDKAQESFQLLKRKLTDVPIFALPKFDKIYELNCDASGERIGGVLSKKGQPFGEKLNEAKLRYSTFDKQFYAIEPSSTRVTTKSLCYTSTTRVLNISIVNPMQTKDKLSW